MNAQSGRGNTADCKSPARFTKCMLSLLATALFSLACASSQTGTPSAGSLRPDGPYKLNSKTNLITNHLARNQDGSINVIIEIPAGTSAKWGVSSDGFSLVRELKGGEPLTINYLPYPGNYGFIPRTLLDTEKGGDGGALDVMVLGPAVARGKVVRARPIGVIRLVDRMEQDDKILAITEGITFQDIHDIDSLKSRYPGVIEILDIWWTHAYGKGTDVNLLGTGSRAQANSVIDYAMTSWLNMRRKNREIAEQDADSVE